MTNESFPIGDRTLFPPLRPRMRLGLVAILYRVVSGHGVSGDFKEQRLPTGSNAKQREYYPIEILLIDLCFICDSSVAHSLAPFTVSTPSAVNEIGPRGDLV